MYYMYIFMYLLMETDIYVFQYIIYAVSYFPMFMFIV